MEEADRTWMVGQHGVVGREEQYLPSGIWIPPQQDLDWWAVDLGQRALGGLASVCWSELVAMHGAGEWEGLRLCVKMVGSGGGQAAEPGR